MTKDEALDLALEALSSIDIYLSDTLSGRVNPEPATYKQWLIDGIIEARNRSRAPITAIKQARSAPVQEPVAWGCNRYIEDDNGFQIGTDEPELAWGKYAPDDNGWWPLYTTPPAAQRQWVGLTDEEYKELHLQIGPVYYYQDYGHAIEAKLKERNT